jgi:hypothetical protein
MNARSLARGERRGSVRWASQPTRLPGNDDIDMFAAGNPESVAGERGHTREFATDADGLDTIGWRIRYREPSLSNPKNPVGSQRGRDVRIVETPLQQVPTPSKHPQRFDRLLDVNHGSRLARAQRAHRRARQPVDFDVVP